MPPNAPLERSATVSPGRAPLATAATMASTEGAASAGTPAARSATHQPIEVEPLGLGDVAAAERGEDDARGGAERARVGLLVQRAAGGRAARLEHGPERALGVARAEGPQRLVDGGRVVREVVVDADATRLEEQILPAPHALEARERGRGHVERDAVALAHRAERGERVAHVVVPGDAHRDAPCVDAARVEIEALPGGVGRRRRCRASAGAVRACRRPRARTRRPRRAPPTRPARRRRGRRRPRR